MGYMITVTHPDGTEEPLCEGMGDKPKVFRSKREAQEMRDFMLIGMEDEVESIDVVEAD
jgi:hypothetical protein